MRRRNDRRRPRTALLPALVLASAFLSSSCTTTDFFRTPAFRTAPPRLSGEASETRERLVGTAHSLLGKGRPRVGGKSFRLDCTGVVQAVYWGAGIDLESPLAAYTGNGVARLYSFLDDRGLVTKGSEPRPGDLIFWDNTYDHNGNGRVDDPLTHVGMVVSVRDNGDLEYIHHNYRRGIILEKMNPRTPDIYSRVENGKTVVVNSPMRMRGSPEYDKVLSGELVRAWGQAYLLK